MNICLNVRLEAIYEPDKNQKAQIEALTELCKKADGFDSHLRFDTHLNACQKMRPWLLAWLYPPVKLENSSQEFCTDNYRSNNSINYDENKRILAGAASAFAPSCKEGEIRACVAPVFRRQGIFKMLYRGLEARLKSAGADTVLLVCEKASPSGVAIAKQLGATYEHGELLMRLNELALSSLAPGRRARLIPVTEELLSKSAAVFSTIFGSSFIESKTFGEAILSDKRQEQFIAISKEGVIGGMAMATGKDGVVLHSMGVLPEFRRRGYGSDILFSSLNVLKKRGIKHISLEVNSENAAAIALYKKAGFIEQSRAEYWRLPGRRAKTNIN